MAKYIISDIFEGNYPISQGYGENPSYYSQFNLKGHEGVDWKTPIGVKITSPFDYEIIRDVDDPKSGNYGDYIVVWDPKQLCAVWYCHLSENYVSIGQKGKKGDILGKTGNSGNTTGPHLHVNFVETDSKKNRLNTSNGYQGFLNILDTNLVEWKIGNESNQNVNNTNNNSLPSELLHYSEKWKEIAVSKGLDVNSATFIDFRNIDMIIAGVRQTYEIEVNDKNNVIKNQNQQINDRNSDIVELTNKTITLGNAIESQNMQIKSLQDQAKKIPSLMEENKQLSEMKEEWNRRETDYIKINKELRKENEELKKNWFISMLKAIFKK